MAAESTEPYVREVLDEWEDNGTMPDNVKTLEDAVVGHRIVSVEMGVEVGDISTYSGNGTATVLTLDNGKRVEMLDTWDCCAHTELASLLLHPERVDHVITGVGTTDGYATWHIYADMGDVLELNVDWSCGNPFYYGYGFYIRVVDSE